MFYLKPNVVVEPLVNNWYASLRLVSPAMAAMIFANSHQKIMASYIASPQIHEMACRNPETIGGPFIDYPTRRVEDVQVLLNKTKEVVAEYISFAEDIKKLQKMLEQHPKGMSLEILYSQLPENLKGYVELYYDLANQPHFRFIEALLYYSPLKTDSLQSILLSLTYQDHRPFCLSTPRLPSSEDLSISLPFKDEFYDRIFHSRTNPLTSNELSYLRKIAVDEGSESTFLNLFTTEKPIKNYVFLEDNEPLRIRYFGHACILIESKTCSILFDPIISYSYPSDIPRFTYADLPEKIDYVVLTHTHQDHVLIEHLLQLRHKINTIVVPTNVPGALQDPSLKLMLENLGFASVIALNEFDKVLLQDGYIQGLPFLGEHADLHIQSKLVYLINICGIKIACAADSNNLDPKIYEKVHEIVGDIDVFFIGMECVGAPLSWLYQPMMLTALTREMDQSRRLDGSNFSKAKMIIDTFNCKQVYVYAMGMEPWLNYVMGIHYTPTSPPIVESEQLINYCKTKNIVSARLFGSETLNLTSLF